MLYPSHPSLSLSLSFPKSICPTVDVPACSRGSLQWTPMRVTVLPQQRLLCSLWMHSLTHSVTQTLDVCLQRTVKIECLRCRSFSPYYGPSTRFFFFYFSIIHRNRLRLLLRGLRHKTTLSCSGKHDDYECASTR